MYGMVFVVDIHDGAVEVGGLGEDAERWLVHHLPTCDDDDVHVSRRWLGVIVDMLQQHPG
jgi:hypothetical protein